MGAGGAPSGHTAAADTILLPDVDLPDVDHR